MLGIVVAVVSGSGGGVAPKSRPRASGKCAAPVSKARVMPYVIRGNAPGPQNKILLMKNFFQGERAPKVSVGVRPFDV